MDLLAYATSDGTVHVMVRAHSAQFFAPCGHGDEEPWRGRGYAGAHLAGATVIANKAPFYHPKHLMSAALDVLAARLCRHRRGKRARNRHKVVARR
jgi:hypothetical protein